MPVYMYIPFFKKKSCHLHAQFQAPLCVKLKFIPY